MKNPLKEYSSLFSLLQRGRGRVLFQWFFLFLCCSGVHQVSGQCPTEVNILQAITCSGADDGVLTVDIPAGVDPDNVLWLFEEDTLFGMVQSGLGPGNYLAFVPGCSALGISLNEPFPFFITSSVEQLPTCDNPCSGVIEATPNFGSGDVTFTWSHNAVETSSTGSGVCEGVVLISATDANGCQDQDIVLVDIPPVEALTFGTSPSCNGLNDGSASAVAFGGLDSGFSFDWVDADGEPVGSEANISGLGAGTYFVTATDIGGCSMTASLTLTDPPPLSVDMTSTAVNCFGGEDGTASVIFSDASFYAWSGPNGFASDGADMSALQNLASGTYSVLVTASNGCIGQGAVDVNQPELLLGEPFESPPTCTGLSNGTAGVVMVGGTPDYSVAWTLPNGESASGAFLTGQPAGAYAFELVDANNCLSTGTVTLTDPAPVEVSLTLTAPLCAEGELANTGGIEAVAEGGLGPYAAGWIDIGTGTVVGAGLTLDNVDEGTYGLGVSDQLGCTVDTVVTLVAPDSLSLSVEFTSPSCFGDSDGQVLAVVEGGTADYAVIWTGGVSPTLAFSMGNLPAGEYVASVSDALGCTASEAVVLVDPEPVLFSATATPVGCSGADGSLVSTASGGVLDYQVTWVGPNGDLEAGFELNGLVPGNYTGELTDANGCAAMASAEVLVLPELTLSAVDMDQDCTTGLGQLTAMAQGGDQPVVLTLEGPSGFVNPEGWGELPQGTYSLVATDQRGCSVDSSFTLTPLISVEVDAIPAGCAGAGEIQVVVFGGSGVYDISGSPNELPTLSNGNTAVWEGLPMGVYGVAVGDGGCTVETEVTIEGVTLFDWTVETLDYGCDEAPGVVSVTVEGAFDPVQYSGQALQGPVFWSTSEAQGLLPGQYVLTVSDGAGCERDTLVELAFASPLSLAANAANISCFGDTDGAISVSAEGGTGALLLGAQGPMGLMVAPLDNLIAGDYTVAVVDDRGCTADTLVTIIEPPSIAVDVFSQPESCAGTGDGSVGLSVFGGTGEMSVQWSGGPSALEWTGLTADTYDWTVTDAQGCSSTGQAEVALTGGLTVTTQVSPGVCQLGVPTANVALYLLGNAAEANVLLGGLPADSTNTSEGEGAWFWNNLAEGNYGWTAVLGEGCGANGSVEVALPAPLSWVGSVVPPPCEGDSGQVQGLSMGGLLPIDVQWSGVSVDGDTLLGDGPSLGSVPSGTYTIVLSDAAGCTTEVAVTLAPLSSGLGLDMALVQPSCGGSLVGQATLLPFGGASPYDVNVEGAADSLFLPFLIPGSYPVTLTDSVGCLVLDTVLIDQASEFLLAAAVDSASCANSEDGNVYLTTSNGTGSVDFTFSGPFGAVPVGDTIVGVAPGVYEVTALDEVGCPAVILVTVEAPPPLFVALDSLFRPSCSGDQDGALFVGASGGSGSPAGWSFNWSLDGDLVEGGAMLSDLGEGDYAVEVVDDAGCTGAISSIPLVAQGDVVLVVPMDTALCAGQVLSLEASASGANQTSWTWPDSTVGPGLDAPGYVISEGTSPWVFTASRLGCIRTDTVQVTGLPFPSPNAGSDQIIPEGGAASIGSEPNPSWTYVWSPSEDVLSPDAGATATEALFESTFFLLTAFTDAGCFSADTVWVEVLNELDIPSGFTPNGDGFNDRWNLGGLDQYPSAQITLFNRWGDVLLTQDANVGSWDGTLGGTPVPVGTYYYHIRVDEPAMQAEWTGPITLMR